MTVCSVNTMNYKRSHQKHSPPSVTQRTIPPNDIVSWNFHFHSSMQFLNNGAHCLWFLRASHKLNLQNRIHRILRFQTPLRMLQRISPRLCARAFSTGSGGNAEGSVCVREKRKWIRKEGCGVIAGGGIERVSSFVIGIHRVS